jgi:hypothetical protein
LIILHCLHITSYKLHLKSHSLDVHCFIKNKLHYALLLAALCKYNLAPSSLFFFNASLAFFIYCCDYFIALADYRAILLDVNFISMSVSSIVIFFCGGGWLPISDFIFIYDMFKYWSVYKLLMINCSQYNENKKNGIINQNKINISFNLSYSCHTYFTPTLFFFKLSYNDAARIFYSNIIIASINS